MSSHRKGPPSSRFAFIFLLLMVVSAFLLFCRLGDIEMRTWDESLYALRAKEMYLSRSLIAPTQGGEVAWSSGKPPFGYWLILLSFHFLGFTPLALRLPFAIAGMGSILLLFLIGQQLRDHRLGLFSAIGLLLMPGFLTYSRQAILEPILTFLFLAALFLFHRSHLCDSKKAILPYSLATGLIIGLAILTKQVVGLLILPALLIYELWDCRKRGADSHLLRSFSILVAMMASSVWWFLIMYGRYGSTFVHHYFGINVLRRLSQTITAADRMAQGFHSVLLHRAGSIPLLVGIMGFLLILFLLRPSFFPSKEIAFHHPTADSLLIPFFLFSAGYYLVFGLISRTVLSWYPFPLLPILALGQGYFLSVCLQASTRQPVKGSLQFLSLLLPLLPITMALSHKLFYISIPLALLFLIYLALLITGSKRRANLVPILGVFFLIFYFSLGFHLALNSRTYHSPDPYPEVARQAKALGTKEVLFDANIGGGLSGRIYPLRFYLEIPIRKAQIEPYLSGYQEGRGKLIITSRDRWMKLQRIASRASSANFLPGGQLITWELNR